MAKLRAAPHVPGIRGGGNVSAPQGIRKRAILDVAVPAAVPYFLKLAVPAG